MTPVKTLLIDNYDSFTFNLFQLLAEVNGTEPVVVRNDGAPWETLASWGCDNIVVSPGPGRPEHAGDLGVAIEAIRHAEVPLLGVCLGHQGLAHVCGGAVVGAPEVMHGRLSTVHHDGSPLFAGIPQDFRAVRYHSLCVAEPLPDALEPLAWTPDGVLMAIARRDRPQWGVQLHPESICTEHGRRLLANFRDLTLGARRRPRRRPHAQPSTVVPRRTRVAVQPRPLALHVERLDRLPDTEQAFAGLYGDARHAFWLDTARPADERSRFSFMGAADGPLSAVVTYDAATTTVCVKRGGDVDVRSETIFEYLRAETSRLPRPRCDLPFEFDCGFAGYFGYELKADCGSDLVHASTLPDAAFVFADRMLAFDHLERRTYLLALSEPGGEAGAAEWIDDTGRRLDALPPLPGLALPPVSEAPLDFRLSRSRAGYLDDIRRCQAYLVDGETYEVCLTTRLTAQVAPDPLALYRTLRAVNPAPFAAFLRLGDAAVVSSSPERFLRIGRDRTVEAKPIKGTIRRGTTAEEDAALAERLRTSEKDRAENLMITDLLRNDLGIVCEVGSVHVPHLMEIETFETVHQLVSTVAGRLREDLQPADCIQACFPGGSMTGAPKQRTMRIIDELEVDARGVYSGAIGYLGCCGGCDLNIVIRTIVLDHGQATIGAGGAIVMQSDPEDELAELLLKARAPMRALALCSRGSAAWRVLDPDEPAHEVLAGALAEA